MLPSEELLQSIDIIAQNAAKNGVKIYTATVTAISDNNTCSVRVNGKTHNGITYYGDAPSVNKSYRVFCPNGSMNQAFIITGGGSSGESAYTLPIASADVLGGIKVGAGLTISTEGTLSATGGGTADAVEWNNVLDKPTTIAGYGITDAKIDGNNVVLGNKTITPYTPSNPPTYPVDSVNGKTGVVVLSAADVGALPNTTVIPDKTSQLDNDSGYITDSALTGYAKKTEIPTKTSELTNDSGYITNTALEPYAKTVDIPTKTSQLNNDSGYITANDVPVKSVDGATGDVVTNAVKTTTQTLTDVQKQQARTNIGAGTSSFDGDYNSLTNKPTIPTKTSQLTNDSGFITDAALTGYAKTTDIPTKTSQLENDSNYITVNEAPVQSVNTKTGAVVLTQDDVGDGTTYVRTHNDFTDALKTQINTNKDNIAMLDGDVDGLQTDVGTLKTNVSSLQTALTSKQDVIVGAASTITENNLVTDRALVSNSSGKVAVSNVTSTELGYLDGVTSNVQTQLNKKLEKAPVTSVNSKTGAVQLNASDVGALPDTTVIPSKTSQLDNDRGCITDIPIASATQLGGVKVGAGLSVTENGVLSATGGGTADAVEWNNVLDKPTTISGYGITDAKIENGTITLGNQTITPLTSAPVTSVNSKTGAVVLNASDVGALPADTVIPTVNDATLTIRRNSVDIGSFTANSANDVNIDINVPTDKSDIGLGNVDNVKQYSVTNPPPYPVTSVNGQTGDVTVDADLPEHLVKYQTLVPVEATTLIDANTLQGHDAAYFAKQSDVNTINSQVSTNTSDISALQSGLSTANANIANKLDKSGGTMTGALVAQSNTNYTTAQVRNVIISPNEPSGGQSGDLWIKYSS